jgi:hypothetical protein
VLAEFLWIRQQLQDEVIYQAEDGVSELLVQAEFDIGVFLDFDRFAVEDRRLILPPLNGCYRRHDKNFGTA